MKGTRQKHSVCHSHHFGHITFACSGLEKAIEARKFERKLCKHREMNNLGDQINADLTYSVEFNLAHMYHANKNYKEAIELFTGALVAIALCC